MIIKDNKMRSAPKSRQCVLMICDNAFFPYATLLARQIRDAHPIDAFDICIIFPDQCDMSEYDDHPLIMQLNLRLLTVEPPEEFKKLETSKYIPTISYLRIIAPDLLAMDYERILYLDCDITYINGDLSKLLDIDLKGRSVGAVLDRFQQRKPKRYSPEFKVMKLSNAPYFNAGVMLVDVDAYVASNISRRALDFATQANPKAKIYHDQSALNLALHKNWAELSPVWNFQYFFQLFFFTHFLSPCFLHSIGPVKFWNDQIGVSPFIHVQALKNHLRQYFPKQYQALNIRDAKDARPVIWWYIFIKHALSYKGMMRYFKRFSDDFEVQ